MNNKEIEKEQSKYSVNAILISLEGNIILQKRDNNPRIVNPGMLCLFGGTVNVGESKTDALKRELMEELELEIESKSIRFFKTYKKTIRTDGVNKICFIYVLNNIDTKKLVLHEGETIVVLNKRQVRSNQNNISRISLIALQEYFQLN